jgi:clorobiocin biosynthesis protein CloN6
MFPLGFLLLKERLRANGCRTEVLNLAAEMLLDPGLDLDSYLRRLDAPVFGIDLHWLAHGHGAIELARKLKQIHPASQVVMGGISATYFAMELIQYEAVDFVVQGYDTLEPMTRLMQALLAGSRELRGIPNLLYKDPDGNVQVTGFSHKPSSNANAQSVDWSFYQGKGGNPLTSPLVLTLPNSGCAFDCGWCGGSRSAFRHVMGSEKTMIYRDHDFVEQELRSLGPSAPGTAIYALQCYSETRDRFIRYLDVVQEIGIPSVHFEQYSLTEPALLKRMAAATNAYVLLSPESHDLEISRLAGRGNYTMAEMEAWIAQALDLGIKGVMVWFFIGMPGQSAASVMETVEYAKQLMLKFPGGHVTPLICPMVPFLDPGSKFFERPAEHGYRIFHRTLEEHRQAMVEPIWYRRLNYETEALSRKELQQVTYRAIAEMVQAKQAMGFFPQKVVANILGRIAETVTLLDEIEAATLLDGWLPAELRREIYRYNQWILAFSTDQIIPVNRQFGNRWFDHFTLDALSG